MNSVLTYIFGENTEILHEVRHKDANTEYICVTDNTNIRSNTWKVVVDKSIPYSNNRIKFAYVKLHPFNYCKGNKVAIIDGAVSPSRSLSSLFYSCKRDLLLKTHPSRHTYYDEAMAWVTLRGLSHECLLRYFVMCTCLGVTLDQGPIYETCCSVWSKSNTVIQFGNHVFQTMLKLTDSQGNYFMSNQLVLSVLANTLFKNLTIGELNQNKWFTRYLHNSTDKVDK